MKLRHHGVSTNGSISRRILRILAESAALYSANHLLYAVLYEVKSQIEITPSYLVSLALHTIGCLSQIGICQQEASVASITCSLIIVRSESAFNRPPTTIGSDPGTMVAAAPTAIGMYSGSPSRKVFAIHSMGVNVGVKTELDTERDGSLIGRTSL